MNVSPEPGWLISTGENVKFDKCESNKGQTQDTGLLSGNFAIKLSDENWSVSFPNKLKSIFDIFLAAKIVYTLKNWKMAGTTDRQYNRFDAAFYNGVSYGQKTF